MDSHDKMKHRCFRIKVLRIILSLFLPTLLGIVSYSLWTGVYREPLFWMSVIWTVLRIFLLMLIPSFVFTIILEYLGVKRIQNQEAGTTGLFTIIIYLAAGTLMGLFYSLIANMHSPVWIHLILSVNCLIVTLIKMRLHIKERRCRSAHQKSSG